MEYTKDIPTYAKHEEVTNYLIAKHGRPRTEYINGRKHITLNAYLSAFDNLIKTIIDCFARLGWKVTDHADEINLIMEYCKEEEYNVIEYISKALRLRCNKKVYSKLFADIKDVAERNLSADKLYSCFRVDLYFPRSSKEIIHVDPDFFEYHAHLNVVEEIIDAIDC